MSSLSDLLLRPEIRPRVIDACVEVVEQEVAAKRGLSGTAVKAGFAVVSKVKPGFIREVVSKLLPDFATALDPIYAEAAAKADNEATVDVFTRTVELNRGRAAEALLGVTDQRIGLARPAVQKAYARLRPNAREHVEAAVPNLVQALRPFLTR